MRADGFSSLTPLTTWLIFLRALQTLAQKYICNVYGYLSHAIENTANQRKLETRCIFCGMQRVDSASCKPAQNTPGSSKKKKGFYTFNEQYLFIFFPEWKQCLKSTLHIVKTVGWGYSRWYVPIHLNSVTCSISRRTLSSLCFEASLCSSSHILAAKELYKVSLHLFYNWVRFYEKTRNSIILTCFNSMCEAT